MDNTRDILTEKMYINILRERKKYIRSKIDNKVPVIRDEISRRKSELKESLIKECEHNILKKYIPLIFRYGDCHVTTRFKNHFNAMDIDVELRGPLDASDELFFIRIQNIHDVSDKEADYYTPASIDVAFRDGVSLSGVAFMGKVAQQIKEEYCDLLAGAEDLLKRYRDELERLEYRLTKVSYVLRIYYTKELQKVRANEVLSALSRSNNRTVKFSKPIPVNITDSYTINVSYCYSVRETDKMFEMLFVTENGDIFFKKMTKEKLACIIKTEVNIDMFIDTHERSPY